MDTHLPVTGRLGRPPGDEDTRAVTGLYQAHAVAMIRIALLMLGDRAAAEDVVQDAFLGLYRRWRWLNDPGKAEAYLRSAVLNGCRDALRRRSRRSQRDRFAAQDVELPSAEATAVFRTVKSTTSRAIAALGRLLKEEAC